jgi:hypothetical protein
VKAVPFDSSRRDLSNGATFGGGRRDGSRAGFLNLAPWRTLDVGNGGFSRGFYLFQGLVQGLRLSRRFLQHVDTGLALAVGHLKNSAPEVVVVHPKEVIDELLERLNIRPDTVLPVKSLKPILRDHADLKAVKVLRV